MSCDDCHIEATSAAQRRVLVTLLVINGAMFVAEIIVGIVAQSSGVIADSLDMLADALVYGVGLYAIGKSAAVKHGAARWAGWFQLALAVSIMVDLVRRAIFGSEPHSSLMMGIAAVALVANAYCLRLLQKHREGEVHMRASWIFTRSDVVANVGVIVAGLLVRLTDSRWPDLIVGAAIAVVVIKGGIEILRQVKGADQVSLNPQKLPSGLRSRPRL
jgi:Co/Zn/Cd efflux system component